MSSFEEKVQTLAEGFIKDLRQHGIYIEMFATGVEASPEIDISSLDDLNSGQVQDLLSVGQLQVIGSAQATLGDFVWEDRNLYPEKFEQEIDLSESLMLDEEDIMRSAFEKDANAWWEED